MASLAGGMIGAGSVVLALKASIDAASNLHEQLNKVDVVFGKNADTVKKWSEGTATHLGLASDKALEFAGVFGNMLKPMGFATDQAAKMSTQLVNLSADMASFNNASPEDTLRALQSGLAGQVRPLRQFGVFLDQARIKQEALNLHLWSGKGNLDASAKAAASYAIILKDTKDAQGDFARTSGGLANQQRILKAQLSDLEAQIGTALMPVVLKITKEMNHWADVLTHSKRVHDDLHDTLEVAATSARTAAKAFNLLSDALGGDKRALESLGAAFAAWKLSGTLATLGATAGAGGAAGSVGLLTTRLKALRALGVITVGVEVMMNRQSIQDFLSKNAGWAGKTAGSSLFMYDTLWKQFTGSQSHGAPSIQRGLEHASGKQANIVAVAQTVAKDNSMNRYVYGGGNTSGPTDSSSRHDSYHFKGFDCSSFVQYVMAQNGIKVPRTSQQQAAGGHPVPKGQLAPGDIVFTEGWPHPGHVGIYIGDGKVIHDPHTGASITTSSLKDFGWNGHAVRYWADKNTSGMSNDPMHDAGGGNTTSTADSKVDLRGNTKRDTGKTHVLTGTKLLSHALQMGLARAGGTKGTSDDLREWRKAEAELLAQPQTLAVAKELADARRHINAIVTADAKKSLKEQQAAMKRHAAEEIAQLKQMDAAWKKHIAVLQKAADDAKRIADRSFQEAASAMMGALDQQRQQLTPAEQQIKDLQDAHAAAARASAISTAQSDLAAAQAAGDPVAIAAAQAALDQAMYDQQLSDLQVQADKERKARDDEYQQKSQALQDWLDDQQRKLDDGTEKWSQFYDDLKKMAAENGFAIGDAFWAAWGQAATDNGVSTAAAAGVAAQPTSLAGIVPPGASVGTSHGSGSYVVGGILVTPPRMASGGIVTGPTLAMVGEAGPEAIIPLNGRGLGGGDVHIHVAGSLIHERDLVQTFQRVISNHTRRNGNSLLG